MAPSRRKGSKAAATAAACRKWKVGDLVLAKVKGFPAWPATVSEPEKWGYSRDWKKVLVYFFGTQQIAFCNPVDVEAFTEEKKQSLLVKRRGKGADFVRAVHEIIDCFEKLRKEEQPDNCNSTDEVAVRSDNMVVEVTKSHLEDQDPTLESSSKEHLGEESEPDFENEAAAAVGASHDGEMLSVDPSSNVEDTRMPATKTYSTRRKIEGGRLRNGSMERRAPSARRLRSSLRTDPEMLQNRTLPVSTDSKNTGCANSVRDRNVRRNRRAGKPSDSLDRHDMDPPAFVLNGSMEDSDSEIATVDSGSLSLNEGSSVESGCKPEYKCVVQCESEFELSQRLEFQNTAVILKKKRKPNRKRPRTDLSESAVGLDKETAPGTFTAKAAHDLPSDTVKSDEKNSKELKEDGDGHLPLVKRARVRMGRSAPEGEVLDNEVQNEGKSPGASDKSLEHAPEGDSSSHQNPLSVNSDAYDSSPSKKCAAKRTPFWETRKQFGSSLDGESALPPSKRLHRALEAMSAYAADDDKKDMEGLSGIKSSINGCCSSSKEDCSGLSDGIKVANSSDVDRVGSLGNVVHEDATLLVASPNALVAEDDLEHLPKVPARATPLGCDDCSENVTGKDKNKVLDAAVQTVQRVKSSDDCPSSTFSAHSADSRSDGELQGTFICEHPSPEVLDAAKQTVQREKSSDDCPSSTFSAHSADSKSDGELQGTFICEHPPPEVLDAAVQTVQRGKTLDDCPSSTSVVHYADAKLDGELQGSSKCEHPSTGPVVPVDEHIENEDVKTAKHFEDPNSEVSGKSADCGSNDEVMTSSPEKGGIMQLSSAGAKCGEINKPCQVLLDGSNQYNEESINLKKAESVLKNTSATSSPCPEKVVGVSLKELHMSGLSSVSDDQLGDKAVSATHSSSSLTDGMDSSARAFSPITLTRNLSTVDSSVHVSNGCSSPLPHQLRHKPRILGKLSSRVEANVALGSFEAALGTLTRTKESISRATRTAIDCAKFGVASKVVEVIAQNLETSSSLHKRVDLFFLVDSIAQFSRGLKGHIGGIYPSAIQGVLPRLLSAAAPPGSSSQENRRQCLKVLRVWQERKILPESVVRPHIRELESFCGLSSSRAFSRHTSRTERNERSFDDPVRDMEGMLVDEYGSNSSFQLPGFRMPPMLKDEEVSDSDGESFEAVTPEHPAGIPNCEETILAIEKRKHILEDVDGELEMEDVSPVCEGEIASISYSGGTDAAQISGPVAGSSFGAPFHPPLPQDGPPSFPPLPTSPPPPPPLPSLVPAPSFPPPSSICSSTPGGALSKFSEGSKNVIDNVQETVFQQCTTEKIHLPVSDSVRRQPSDIREIHGEVLLKVADSDGSCPSSNGPVSHLPFCLTNGVHPPDGASSKGFHLRPPHPAPSNQFSYVHVDQRRDMATPYSNVVHMQNADSRSFCRDRNGMKSARREIGECWVAPSHYSGPCYPDGTRGHYAAGSYPVPHEPPLPSHRWDYPPRGMNRREFHSHRPPPDRPIPVSSRGPGFWRPR